ncbi:hypothetical protein E2C01_052110 [Portunus trituberculatus]|uniref:Uncharacterized protein n=1 Tax=Portunus trituberculatus TaxID=210409 RepID=A0A5B7GL16_PORTR|nr:hypothetical protein [Portunus trituberculatus]
MLVRMDSSPKDTIMESLAVNMDGSEEVSWSSALATPTSAHHGHTLDCTSPSTLERQTLHPRQGLRENVSYFMSSVIHCIVETRYSKLIVPNGCSIIKMFDYRYL